MSNCLRATATKIASDIRRLQAQADWPSSFDAIVSVVSALIVTIVELQLSSKIGLLSVPPVYDGVAYMVEVRSAFYRIPILLSNPRAPLEIAYGMGTFYLAPLWDGLMLLSFTVLGQGEWQATATRFWPIFLLALLILWISRKHGGYRASVAALPLTALLPVISASLRAGESDFFAPTILAFAPLPGTQAHLADLRPDLLSSALLLWAVVPLLEHLENPDKRTWVVSSTAASLCILAKSATFSLLLSAWGIAIAMVLYSNRSQIRPIIKTAIWGLIPIAILTGPWIIIGGANAALTYFLVSAFSPLWRSSSHPTLASEITFYWRLFPVEFGYYESWISLALGLAATLASLITPGIHKRAEVLGYLLIAAVLCGIVSASPNKGNPLLGLPFMFSLWILTWRSTAPHLREWFVRRKRFTAAILLLTIYILINLFAGLSGAYGLSANEQQQMVENRNTVRNIAADMRLFLNNSDCFMYAPAYGFPATLQYYMMDKDGAYPKLLWIDQSVTPDEFIQQSVSKCRVVLVDQADVREVAMYFTVGQINEPYYTAIWQWVKSPSSGYTLYKNYVLISERFNLTISLFVRQDALFDPTWQGLQRNVRPNTPERLTSVARDEGTFDHEIKLFSRTRLVQLLACAN